MRHVLKKPTICMGMAAAFLLGASAVSETMAYFTTHVAAEGGQVIELGATSTIEEEVSNMTKHVVLTNTGKQACFVRIKAFAGEDFLLEYLGEAEDWKAGEDGYWYYQKVLQAGEKTQNLDIKIHLPSQEYTKDFNVIVIQETAPAVYDAEGNASADWTRVMDTTTGIDNGKEAGA